MPDPIGTTATRQSRGLGSASVLILDQPTAGVDVGVKAELYGQVRGMARDGVAFIIISDDLDERLLLSDRIIVMRAGSADQPRAAESFSRAGLLEAITRQVRISRVLATLFHAKWRRQIGRNGHPVSPEIATLFRRKWTSTTVT